MKTGRALASGGAFAAGSVLAIGLTGCSSPPGTSPTSSALSRPIPVLSPSSPTPQTRPYPTAGAGQVLVAGADGRFVQIFRSPAPDRPMLRLPNPWLLNGATTHPVRQWFLVRRTRADGWVQVLLPERPNGRTGWIAPRAAQLLVDPYRIDVSLRRHQIVVTHGGRTLYRGPVATGKPATPTPTGLYYLRVLLHNSNPGSVYGPYAYGLSAHSEALTTFNGGDAEIGIHGNNDASVLGTSVTHGCIRMDNGEITRLARLLPLGTPVRIHE